MLQDILEATAKARGIMLNRIYPDNAQQGTIVYDNGITLNAFEMAENIKPWDMIDLVERKLK